MKIFLDKINRAYAELTREKGDFLLFACVELAVNESEWDVVVCADWLPKVKRKGIDIIINKLRQFFEKNDFLTLSRVIILDKKDSFYCELKDLVKNNKELTHNVTIAGLDVKQIHILQFQSDEITQSAGPAIYNEIAKLDNLKVLQDIKNLVDSKIRAKETANFHRVNY